MNLQKAFTRFVTNSLISLLPTFKAFFLRSILLRLQGHDIAGSARICGHIKIFGYGKLIVGERTWIGPNCNLYIAENYYVCIHDDCDIGPQATFVTGSHVLSSSNRRAGKGTNKNIVVHSGCWIGIDSTLLGGCIIGKSVVLGAKSLALGKSYSDNTIYGGIPLTKLVI